MNEGSSIECLDAEIFVPGFELPPPIPGGEPIKIGPSIVRRTLEMDFKRIILHGTGSTPILETETNQGERTLYFGMPMTVTLKNE